MRILVIAPHMDDETLGAGGTIARHVKAGEHVSVCCVAHRVYNHRFDKKQDAFERKCAQHAQKILGYRDLIFLGLPDERLDTCLQDVIIPLEKVVKQARPDVVYLNHHGDNNQDHRAVFQAAMVALRPVANPSIQRVLCYETPSSTDQSPPLPSLAFLPNYYVNIAATLPAKIAALKAYRTEIKPFPHPRSVMGIETQAKKRGMESGFQAAEAFVQIRDKWP